MNNIFEILNQSVKANQIALDQQGRIPYPTLGIVVNNQDELGRRRIKVSFPSSPSIESDWIRRLDIAPGVDANLPPINSTVLVFFVDGLESNACYLPIVNDTNPPKDKEDVVNDYHSAIPGDKNVSISGADTLNVSGEVAINSEKSIISTATQDVKAYSKRNIFMQALQAITLSAAQYVLLQAGTWAFKLYSNGTSEVTGGVLTIDCGGYGFRLTNVGTMTINNQPVAVVGATDSRGDHIVTSGWS
ncbi:MULTISPECIES: phage baseplate assembly protein V [unclassified Nostoc]|uniref:phage baseplate assembly protein V n=1 Tax=unclassified Nostoc TaxID=2593658 RepID=UPI002AD3BC06|nr:phage baseplate assembly protein V [Nostoc sp. DedQUE03]MDZ7975534.1 phage baseplate assembly protein V [Nostoc sp. DedQUE03]MDZ8045588.1 phage baseplate assembly protein V [Nostoc sp. DedQUE02]